MEQKLKYWVALDGKGAIISVGLTLSDEMFNRRCFPFAVSAFEAWAASQGRYCQLDIIKAPLQYKGMNIKDVPHYRIRKSRDLFSMFSWLE